MNRNFGPMFAWSSSRSKSGSTLLRWICLALVTIIIILITASVFPGYQPSFLESKSDELRYQTVPLTYLPPLGLGTWQLPKSKAARIVKVALEKGYRHIDAAMIYGNEKEVGEGIAQAGIPRSSIWVTSKLWNTDHRPSSVRPALKKTLQDLGLEYLDLYLMHWPVAFQPGKGREIELEKVDILETWWAMEELVREGLVRQIGISNFNQPQVERLLRYGRIPPSVHELESHPYLSQSEFVNWNLQQGLRVIAFSPLGNMNPIYKSSNPPLLEDEFLSSIAHRKGITVAQLVLAWSMHRGVVVIPKSEHEERVLENWEAQRVVLTDEEVAYITAYDKQIRFNNPSAEWGTELYTGLDGV